MKISKDYIIERLQNTSVEDLAAELTVQTQSEYAGVDVAATQAKFEAMLKPLAPKTIKAVDLARQMGITVVNC